MYDLIPHEGYNVTDITNAKKKVIRSRARRFALDLHDAPLDSGLELYQSTIDELYEGSSRLRLCLKCGAIDTTDNLKKDTHSCALDFKSFPVLVTTSWKLMGDFFLTNKYIKALQQIGVELGEREIITVPVEVEAEEPTVVKVAEKANASTTDK